MKLLVFSDIHGDAGALEKLMAMEADYYIAAGDLTSWGRGLETLGRILERRSGQVYVLPGNHESEAAIAAFCRQFGLHPFHGQHFEAAGYQVAGLGYSNPTPFHTPGEYPEPEIARRLAAFAGLEPLVLVCHCPPLGTALDRMGNHAHIGSSAVRQFIEKHQPAYFVCGHVHEAEGQTERLGRSFGANAGKKGYLLTL